MIGCVYRSPSSNSDNNQKLLEMFLNVKDLNPSHLLIMGDFNLKEIDWNINNSRSTEVHIASQFLECVRDCFYINMSRTIPGTDLGLNHHY